MENLHKNISHLKAFGAHNQFDQSSINVLLDNQKRTLLSLNCSFEEIF